MRPTCLNFRQFGIRDSALTCIVARGMPSAPRERASAPGAAEDATPGLPPMAGFTTLFTDTPNSALLTPAAAAGGQHPASPSDPYPNSEHKVQTEQLLDDIRAALNETIDGASGDSTCSATTTPSSTLHLRMRRQRVSSLSSRTPPSQRARARRGSRQGEDMPAVGDAGGRRGGQPTPGRAGGVPPDARPPCRRDPRTATALFERASHSETTQQTTNDQRI